MEPELITYFTPLCVMLIMLTCCLRFAIKGCIRRTTQMNEFYASQYCSGSSHQCNRIFVGDGGVRGVVITRLPSNQQACPQIMGYVLDASLLSPVQQIESSPRPPRYEDALKPISAPPKYEESSSGSSAFDFPDALPSSSVTTARLESSLDETETNEVPLAVSESTRRHSEGDCWMTARSGDSGAPRSSRLSENVDFFLRE